MEITTQTKEKEPTLIDMINEPKAASFMLKFDHEIIQIGPVPAGAILTYLFDKAKSSTGLPLTGTARETAVRVAEEFIYDIHEHISKEYYDQVMGYIKDNKMRCR